MFGKKGVLTLWTCPWHGQILSRSTFRWSKLFGDRTFCAKCLQKLLVEVLPHEARSDSGESGGTRPDPPE